MSIDTRRVAMAAAFLGALALTLHGQTSAGTGRVLADDTGDPIPNARVSIVTTAEGTTTVRADDQGRFAVPEAAGGFRIVATKFGYVRREITVAAGRPIEIRLQRAAVISGRVIDEFGDPAPSIRVTAEQVRTPGVASTTVEAVTDDLGEYRLTGLSPRSVVVWAETVRTDTPTAVVNGLLVTLGSPIGKAYYPGVTTPQGAEPLTLKPGDDRTGIDFVVRLQRPPGVVGVAVGVPPPPPPPERDAAAADRTSAPAPPAGIIRGRVTSTDGRVVPHATVRLIPTPPAGVVQFKTTTTDDVGAYELAELAAGTYRVVANRVGYSPIRVDDPASSQPPFGSTREVTLVDGEAQERIDVRLARWGTLSGRVVDEIGDPLAGANVQVMQARYLSGRRRLVPVGDGSRLTDDLGRYRLFGMPPGQYVVSASVGAVASADLPGYARSYFPGTPNPGEAQFVTIGQSQDVTAIDFAMSSTRTALVSGTVLGPDGDPTSGGSLRLLSSARSASVTSASVGARILRDGRFEFPNVAPGQYVIQADHGRKQPSVEGEFGALAVAVNGADVTDLVLQMSEGSSISGRFVFDSYDPSTPPPTANVELMPVPVDFDASPQSVATAAIADDWTFEMSGINGPRRLQLQRPPPGWMLKEIRVGGIDVTDQPLPFGSDEQSLTDVEIALTDRVTGITGAVTGTDGRPSPAASVLLFPTDRDRWFAKSRFIRRAIAGADGSFKIVGAPPGGYYAVALLTLPSGGEDSWQDPDFLDALLSRATTLTLREGETQPLPLRLAR
jgi:hypothetical protein